MINDVVNTLLPKDAVPHLDRPISEYTLPFCDGSFKLEFWRIPGAWGVTMRHRSELIGFKEFEGPHHVMTRYNDNNIPTFFGFENYLGRYFCNHIEKAPLLALWVDEAYRERYSGIGKTIVTTSLAIMIEILKGRLDKWLYPSPEAIDFKYLGIDTSPRLSISGRFNKTKPIFVSKNCFTPLYREHYQARSTDYYSDINDVAVLGNVQFPPIEITKK